MSNAALDAIYATASDPIRWPTLLAALQNPGCDDEYVEHLEQALALSHHADVVPLPCIAFDRNGCIVFRSTSWSGVRHQHPHFPLQDNQLTFRDKEVLTSLSTLTAGQTVSYRRTRDTSAMSDTLLCECNGLYALVWFEQERRRAVQQALQQTHELTSAEANLVWDVLTDAPYADIASIRGVTVNTVRSQVKQIFAKLGCGSRGELVHRIFTQWLQPARLLQSLSPYHDDRSEVLDTEVGKLGYRSTGDSKKAPWLVLHGPMGSRHYRPMTLPSGQDTHLVCIDRPGVGWTDVAPADFSFGINQLLDQMGFATCNVLAVDCPQTISTSVIDGLASRISDFKQCSSQLRVSRPIQEQTQSLYLRSPKLATLAWQLAANRGAGRILDRCWSAETKLNEDTDEYLRFAQWALDTRVKTDVAGMVREIACKPVKAHKQHAMS